MPVEPEAIEPININPMGIGNPTIAKTTLTESQKPAPVGATELGET